IKKVIERYFLTLNILVDDDALFQNKFPTTLWQNISRAVKNLSKLPLWFNHELSNTAFGGKQTYDFWQRVFQTGKTPYGERIMQDGLDLDELLKE
ncbi:MAG: HNH endonuclease, partial [bacterium]